MNNFKIRLKFKGSCLKQEDKAAYFPKNMVNLFIIYELDTNTKNAVKDKYKYSGYNIGFDSRSEFSLPDW